MTSDPSVTILNVGHGNAAVIRDGDVTVVVDTGGEHAGGKLLDYLRSEGLNDISALLLSHGDEDHIGSAPTLLLAKDILVRSVFVNTDTTKRTAAFGGLQLALQTSRRERQTVVTTSLTIAQTQLLPKKSLSFEILFPPPESTLTGAGGQNLDGTLQTTNSLSAVVRVSDGHTIRVLFPGDSDSSVLDFWKKERIDPSAEVVVFPHHGGRPGQEDPSTFAEAFTRATKPSCVVFSIHETKHALPRSDVVVAICTAQPSAQLICTQLPSRLVPVCAQHPWSYHTSPAGTVSKLHVQVGLVTGGISIIKDDNLS